MDLKEILRNNDGLIGDTTRTLTEYYFNFIYNPKHLKKSCERLLEYRNEFYETIPKVNGLTSYEITQLSDIFHNNLPALMLIFYYIECYVDENFQEIIDASIDTAYIVAIEEHTKTARIKGHLPLTDVLSDEGAHLLSDIIESRYK